jgi:O-succinylbenzoic acid--CoA ligase
MIYGRDLPRETDAPADAESALLLNPRWPAPLRKQVLSAEFPDLGPHVWVATSGTSGQSKIVALSRPALEASARAVNRRLAATGDDVWLNPLPLFHVGGLGIVLRAGLAGAVYRALADWNPEAFVRRAGECGATLSALVPAQVHDLVAAGLPAPPCLRAVVVGGGELDSGLRKRAAGLGWPLLPSYGLTEAASQVATARIGAEASDWLPLLDHVEARVGGEGVLELRGPSLLTGWILFDNHGRPKWEDPKRDGWYRTSDRVEMRGRELRVLGRLDDLVKIRGELVDVATLERELQARVTSGRIAVRMTPDRRNGFALRVVAENEAARDEAARACMEVFPAFARPESVVTGAIERTALGKTVRR